MPAPLGNHNARKKAKERLDSRLNFACKKTEKAAWKKAAKRDGYSSLSDWLRAVANANT